MEKIITTNSKSKFLSIPVVTIMLIGLVLAGVGAYIWFSQPVNIQINEAMSQVSIPFNASMYSGEVQNISYLISNGADSVAYDVEMAYNGTMIDGCYNNLPINQTIAGGSSAEYFVVFGCDKNSSVGNMTGELKISRE